MIHTSSLAVVLGPELANVAASLAAAIADAAGVNLAAVVVTLTTSRRLGMASEGRRLQAGSLTAAYTISAPSDVAAQVAQRVNSMDLHDATLAVQSHLVSVDVLVTVASVSVPAKVTSSVMTSLETSADLFGESDSPKLITTLVGAGAIAVGCFFLMCTAVCCFCTWKHCCRGSGKKPAALQIPVQVNSSNEHGNQPAELNGSRV